MREFKLIKRQDGTYDYMSKKDSELFESVKDSDDPKDILIKKLLLDKAKGSHNSHCASKY